MNGTRVGLLRIVNEILKDVTVEELRKRNGGNLKFPVSLKRELLEADLTELELSVRSYNGLKRAGVCKVGDLVEGIERSEDLLKIRNLGKKSVDEIMLSIFLLNYSLMHPERQKGYLERVKELNQWTTTK